MAASGGSGGGLGCFKAALLFLIVIGGGYFILTGSNGLANLPSLPSNLIAPPNDPSFYEREAQWNQSQADNIREQNRLATQAEWERRATLAQEENDYHAQETLAVQQQTAEVERAQTQEAWRVTVEAGQAQGTATAQAQATAARQTQIVVDNKATADIIVLVNAQRESTLQAQKDALQIQRDTVAAQVDYQLRYWPALLGAIIVTSGLIAGWKILRMREKTNIRTIKRNPDGSIEGVAMEGKLFNLDRSTSVVVDPKRPVPELTAEQIEATRREQGVQAIRALTVARMTRQARQGAAMMTTGQEALLQDPVTETGADSSFPVDVPWSVMDSWPGKKWTLGQGIGGTMIGIDPDDDSAPHLLGAGTTGSGKTHFLLHPITAQALADGYLVFAVGRSANGFSMFANHPNMRIQTVDKPEHVTPFLAAAYEEIIRRERALEKVGVWKWSLWKDAPDPRILIVIDEFSNLADDMDTAQDREALWRHARMVAAEGRKAGVLLAIALQDPTHRSMDLRIRRNCTPVTFRLLDNSASHVVLGTGGAERLEKKHFMTVINAQVVEGVAFDASADDFQRFLSSRPVPQLAEPKWLQLNPGEAVNKPKTWSPEIISIAEKIEELWLQGASKRDLAVAAGFPQFGGSFAGKINDAIDFLAQRGATTATTTTEDT